MAFGWVLLKILNQSDWCDIITTNIHHQYYSYSTYYTMAPVFSLVLDEDVSDDIAFTYPELYHELQKGRAMSYKTFFIWLFTSIWQGGVIMLLSLVLFEDNLINIVAITFSALILTELSNVAFEIRTWNKWMIISEFMTVVIYFGSIFVLQSYFGKYKKKNWIFRLKTSFGWQIWHSFYHGRSCGRLLL